MIVFVLFVFICCSIALSSAKVLQRNTVEVAFPVSLAKQVGTIHASPALFGAFLYGTTLSGPAFKASDNNAFACDTLQTPSSGTSPSFEPFILVARRGGKCSFVQKALQAQLAGAAALIVVDDHQESDERMPYMGVTGAESSISHSIAIPLFLIEYTKGFRMLEDLPTAINNKTSVRLDLSVELPSTKGKEPLNIDFFTSVFDPLATAFKHNFRAAIDSLGKNVVFKPHYPLDEPEGDISPSCTNHGRYCSTSRSHVEETARQLCVNQLFGSSGWWKYIERFETLCIARNVLSNECSNKVLLELGLSSESVVKCIHDAGGIDADKNVINTLLQTQIEDPRKLSYTPVLFVNDAIFPGEMQCVAPISLSSCPPLKSICFSFDASNTPETCMTSDSCSLGLRVDVCGKCRVFGSKDFETDETKCIIHVATGVKSLTPIILALIAIVIMSIAMFMRFERKRRQRVRNEIDAIMSHYSVLPHEDDDGESISLLNHPDGYSDVELNKTNSFSLAA